MAKKGEVVTWHFAHYEAEACQSGYESAIHLAVKKIIETKRVLLLSRCHVLRHPNGECVTISKFRVNRAGTRCWGDFEYHSRTPDRDDPANRASGFSMLPSKLVQFDEVIVEQQEGDIRPDLIGVIGDKRLYIEVAVTHFIDKEKERRIRVRGVPAIEIQIEPLEHDFWSFERLEARIVGELSGKHWIFNPRAEAIAQEDHIIRLQAEIALAASRKLDLEKQRAEYDREREKLERVKAKRKEVFEKYYKPIFEVEYRPLRNSMSTIAIKLCPTHVSIKVNRRFTQSLADVVGSLAKKHGGTYNATQYQWELPAKEEIFFSLALALNEQGDFRLDRVQSEDSEKERFVLQKLGRTH